MRSTRDRTTRPAAAETSTAERQPPLRERGEGARLLLRFLRSVRLALVLIGYLVAASALSTLIPQNQEIAWYQQHYPTALSRLILAFGLHAFFRSALFLLPAGLFVVNLAFCTVHRLAARHRAGARRRYGPDIVHVGFLLLLAGGAATVFGREEQAVYLPEGHEVTLPGGSVLKTVALEVQEYPDGRPRDWLTTVELTPGDAWPGEASGAKPRVFTIEVNHPLRVGGVKVYQTDFYRLPVLEVVQEPAGEVLTLIPGRELQTPSGTLRYRGLENEAPAGGEAAGRGTAVFEWWKEDNLIGERRVAVGGSLEGYRLSSLRYFPVTGLRVVRDPGFQLVIPALILIAFGLTLTFAQKPRKEETP